MSFSSIASALESTAKKAANSVTGKHEDDDKEKDDKEKKEKEKDTSSSNHENAAEHHEGAAEKLSASAFGTFGSLSIDGFKETLHTMTNAGMEAIGRYANGAFHLFDGGGNKTDTTKPELKPTETPTEGNPFDYNSWMNIWNKQQETKPPEQHQRKSLAERVTGWVGNQWDSLFGEGTLAGDGKASQFETTDAKGNKATTTMSDKGVDHVSEDGSKIHADGDKVVSTDGKGNTYGLDKRSGDSRYEQANGLVTERDAETGSYTMKDKNGNEVHVAKNGDITYEHDGHKYTINGKAAVHHYNGARWVQNRPGGDPRQQEAQASEPCDGKPTFTTITDPEDPHNRMVIVNDGDGNVMKLRGNGDVILSNKDNPNLELVSNQKTHETRVRIDGQEYFIQHQPGTDGEDRWYLYKSKDMKPDEVFGWINPDGQVYSYNPDDKTQTGQRLGELKGLRADGTMSNGAATLRTDGQVQSNIEGTQIDQQDMRVTKTGPDGKTTLRVTEQGASNLTNVSPDGSKAETSDMDPHGRLVTQHDVPVDTATGEPARDENGIATGGTIETDSKVDPNTGQMITQVNEGDGKMMTITGPDPNNPDAGPQIQYSNGAEFYGDGTFEDTAHNKFGPNGQVHAADGTDIDEYGNVSHNGKYMGTSGGFNNNDGGTAARVSAILGLAESIKNCPNPDPGKIAMLLSLYDALSTAGACALANNDVGGFIHADLAKACVSGAISNAQAAEARTQLAQYFTDHPLTTDQIVQVQQHMSGVSVEELKQFAEKNGLTKAPANA